MTVAALRALLDDEQPDVPRPPAVHVHRRPTAPPKDPAAMTTPTPQAAAPQPTAATIANISDLLTWAAHHDDPTVRQHGEQASTALAALHERRRTDAELAQITTEATELEQRLAALRARQSELQPAKKARKKPRAARDYDPREVRAWTKANGITVPTVGLPPKTVVDAWRNRPEATTAAH